MMILMYILVKILGCCYKLLKPVSFSKSRAKICQELLVINVLLDKTKPQISQVEMLDWFGQDISPEQDKSLRKSIVEEGNSRGTPCWTGKCISKYLMLSRFYFYGT